MDNDPQDGDRNSNDNNDDENGNYDCDNNDDIYNKNNNDDDKNYDNDNGCSGDQTIICHTLQFRRARNNSRSPVDDQTKT